MNRDFPLGSMTGSYTSDELNTRLDELQSSHSNLISNRIVIVQSVEGRDLWAFKVSDNPNNNTKYKTGKNIAIWRILKTADV